MSWIARNAVSLATTDPTASLTDITAFGQMVGSAHIVGLGEGTHGTREFALQKHRFIKYLAESEGFTHLAVEVSQPDAELINQYVLTGQGDPVRLLSGLRFWNTNTQEMLDLVKWMRQWNTTVASPQRPQFHGFDMQNATGALDSVEKFISRVDTANTAFVRTRYLRFDPYKSYGSTFGAPIAAYSARLATSRAACALGAKEVHDLIAARADVYKARSSADEYEYALHASGLVQQWEAFATKLGQSSGELHARFIDGRKSPVVAHPRRLGIEICALGAQRPRHAHQRLDGSIPRAGQSVRLRRAWLCIWRRCVECSDKLRIVGAGGTPGGSTFLLDRSHLSEGEAGKLPAGLATHIRERCGFVTAGRTGDHAQHRIDVQRVGPAGFSRLYYFPDDFDLLVYINSAHETTLLPYVF